MPTLAVEWGSNTIQAGLTWYEFDAGQREGQHNHQQFVGQWVQSCAKSRRLFREVSSNVSIELQNRSEQFVSFSRTFGTNRIKKQTNKKTKH